MPPKKGPSRWDRFPRNLLSPGNPARAPTLPPRRPGPSTTIIGRGSLFFPSVSRGSCANPENLLGEQLAAAFSGPFHFSFFEKRPGGLAARPKRLLGHVADPEVLLHRIFAALVAALAVFEWRVQTGRVASATIRLVFPMLIAVSGALLLTHSHSLGDVKEEVLAELSHIPLAILAVMAGWSRWLELRLPAENHTRAWLTRLWPVRISLIGILLLNYREM